MNAAKYVGQSSGPIPFGLQEDIREYFKGTSDPWSYIISSTGIGRPGQSSEEGLERERKRARGALRPRRPK